ncbi:MAG: hypothetical protein WC341_12100 [Bacteroidales bacterium]|jgi:hypothetical protein
MESRIKKWLTSKYAGWTWLSVIVILLIIRLWSGGCNLLICGLFVATVVAYIILTDKNPS